MTAIIVGPGGEPAAGYVHVQAIPADVWTIEHRLGFVPGAVAIVDSAGSVVVGETVHLDATTVEVRFAVPFAGRAFLS